ncbi:MAG: hypothetical protein IT385_16615 [Deltaproteobacteria bacterium]|nr:hypothetical protein [Deltaproteobacteria bacterium]
MQHSLARPSLVLPASVLGALALASSAHAQPFYESGSTGALGPLMPTANLEIPLPEDGVLHFTTIDIPEGVTVTFVRNADNTPVYLLASDDVTIDGVVDVSGRAPVSSAGLGGVSTIGGIGGPGGSDGGCLNDPANWGEWGLGPGGAVSPQISGGHLTPSGAASLIEGGSASIQSGAVNNPRPYGASGYMPLHAGSGGGSALGYFGQNPGAGGGGGGGIVIASSGRITVSGEVRADGGAGGGAASYGSGGFIRLAAAEVEGTGKLYARGSRATCNASAHHIPGCSGDGLIRIEAYDILGTLGTTAVPAPFYAEPQPAVPYPSSDRPILRIAKAHGKVPYRGALVGHAIQTPGVALPTGVAVAIELEAQNVPPGYVAQVYINAVGQQRITVTSTPFVGTWEQSTATAEVTVPAGVELGVIEAWIPNVPLAIAAP